MASATLIGTDLVTKGNWIGVYGADGRRAHTALTVVIPAGITVVAAGAAAFQWVAVSADPRYLLRPDANPSNRFGGGYVGGNHFVDLSYTEAYHTWLYAVDGDATNRRMLIKILDRDNSLAELSRYDVNFNFNPGVWIGWTINGNVRIDFTQTGGANCVYSGLFWTTATAPPGPPDVPSILLPLEDAVVDRQLLVTVSDVSGSTPETVEYLVEHEPSAGAGWVTLIDWTDVRPVNQEVLVGSYPEGTDHRLRATARALVTESDPSAVVTFTIEHENLAPSKPTVTWEGYSDYRLMGLISEFHSLAPGATGQKTEWQVATDSLFTSPLQTVDGLSYEKRMGSLGSSAFQTAVLAMDTSYWIRGRWVDEVDLPSEWSDPVRAKTSYVSNKIGVGDIGWAGGLVAGGLVVKDYSGGGRHGRFTYTAGGDGSSYLNQGVTSHDPMFPVNKLPSYPSIVGLNKGVRLPPDTTSPFVYGGGRALTWSVHHTSPDKLAYTRWDGLNAIPDFSLIISFLVEYTGGENLEICVLGEAKQSTPVATSPFLYVRILPSGEIAILFNAIVSAPATLGTGIVPVPGQLVTLRISHKYIENLGDPFWTSIVRLNGATIYGGADLARFQWGANIEDVGHFRLGTFASANLGGAVRHAHGIFVEAGLWWDEQLDHENPAGLSPTETVALTPEAMLAINPTIYWRLDDPVAPEKPILSVV